MKKLSFTIILLFALSFAYNCVACAQDTLLFIKASSSVEFVVIDALGRRTGHDPVTNQWYQDIPYIRYSHEEIDDLDGTYSMSMNVLASEGRHPLPDGAYTIRVIGVSNESWDLWVEGNRGAARIPDSSTGGQTAHGKVNYVVLNWSSNTGVPPRFVPVAATRQVSGGIFNPSGSTLTVRAKPSVSFPAGNSLKTLIVTLKWLSSYNISLGAVTSTLGFAKWDSVITQGSYKYQKFRTTTSTGINWSVLAEYDLFSVPVSGGSGTGTFELTNAIPGGEWFVDINYSDKSDTTFYHPADDEMEKSRDSLGGYRIIPNSFVPGHGTTNEPQSYFFIDSAASPGTTFYGLRQIDLNGRVDSTDCTGD